MCDTTMCDSSWSVLYAAICAYKAKALKEEEEEEEEEKKHCLSV